MKRKINSRLQKRILGIMAVGIVILVASFLIGCQSAPEVVEDRENFQDQTGAEGDDAMELHKTAPYGGAPPIDLKLPENLETATFGMG